MIKRSVSTAVARFGKVNVVANVGKMQMRQIVGDSANLVDWPFLAGPRLSAIGSTRSAWGWSSRLIPVRHSHLISLGKLKDVSLGVLSVAHQLREAIVAFQVTHLNTRT